jgi:hypothetical protein
MFDKIYVLAKGGEKVVKRWSKGGQKVVKRWSKGGQKVVEASIQVYHKISKYI